MKISSILSNESIATFPVVKDPSIESKNIKEKFFEFNHIDQKTKENREKFTKNHRIKNDEILSQILIEDNNDINEDLITNDYLEKRETYKKNNELKLNIINNLDRNYSFSHSLKILKFIEIKLNNQIIKNNEISVNYVDRVVTEDISSRNNKISDTNKNKEIHHIDLSKPLHHNTTRGKEFKWGSTRHVNKIERRSKRIKRPFSTTSITVNDSTKENLTFSENVNEGRSSNGNSTSKKAKIGIKKKSSGPGGGSIVLANKKSKSKTATSTSVEVCEDEQEKNNSFQSSSLNLKSSLNKDGVVNDENEIQDESKKINVKENKISSKQYDNVYFSIWKDLSRKDGPKVSRLMQQSSQAKLINLKKTFVLASREAKRWQLKNNKNQKDLITKARRAMREMFNFWKRNERIERELRKKHEKELFDKAKSEEEEREYKRQSRKLNFLLTQTELYSHFVCKKIKTDKIEGKDKDLSLDFKTNNSINNYSNLTQLDIDDSASLDFDNDDDEKLNKAAAIKAQNALNSARMKAKLFDNIDEKSDDNFNFQVPVLMGEITIPQPKLLKCTLKEYQLKGLNWLANLYEQGINGILADEMGLGKTVQSISVLSYLTETHNIWGPFLVVTPASTLHNWQQEFMKFVPDFKVLPYWSNAKDRKILRKFWDKKNVKYNKDSSFHVLITSYQLVVADAAYFQKMKWQYMILDEAQAIKSSQSSRWKSLLSFSCRNRLLLTGTPIQNSMQELWALLHFIMPSLFDSHDEFSDWFSKDIESHAQSNTSLDEQQLKRLHVILKPFMLRRIKKNVQSELGEKKEIDIFCDLTSRQKKYYQMLKSQISIIDLLDFSSTNDDANSLINLVMQFRKVCNHPDLFERADVQSSFSFSRFARSSSFLRENNNLELYYTTKNLIEYKIPKLIYDELLTYTYNNNIASLNLLYKKFSIFDINNIIDSENFCWLKYINITHSQLQKIINSDLIMRSIQLMLHTNHNYDGVSRFKYLYDDELYLPETMKFLIVNYNNNYSLINNSLHLKEFFSIKKKVYENDYINVLVSVSEVIASAPPIDISCSRISFQNKLHDILFNQKIIRSLMPLSFETEYQLLIDNVSSSNYPKCDMLPRVINKFLGYSSIRMPSMNRFITESGKLSKLDELLDNLKSNGHRVLIYFQMTKMMDLMEDYLTFRQHKYIRLDGSSKLDDRRDLVHDWQTKSELFIFLLSTRAGGLGINLTAADTVIFYDSDWNPTIDSQAMDRAHRLGQTRQVTVYRLLTRNTIEERMRDRAKQKEQVQKVVMEGKAILNKKDNINKKKDVAFLLLGDDVNERKK